MNLEDHIPEVVGHCDAGIYQGCACGWRDFHETNWLQHLEAARPHLDVERLAVAMNTAQIEAIEIRLGHDLMVPAERIAKAYDASVPSKPRG